MPLRIQVASDLHHEMLALSPHPHATLITPAANADLLILAGDIDGDERGVLRYAKWPVPVLYVAGNHEFYGREMRRTRSNMEKAVVGTRVTYMEQSRHDVGPVRVLACTLWTDYKLNPDLSQQAQLEAAQQQLNDHRRIHIDRGPFTAKHALEIHTTSRRWLEEQLQSPHDGPTVVVTHHGPHPLSVHERYAGDALNAAFCSDLSDLLCHADLWIHGHVHDSFDYTVGRCRVVANPLGYPANRGFTRSEAELRFENASFQRELVLEI